MPTAAARALRKAHTPIPVLLDQLRSIALPCCYEAAEIISTLATETKYDVLTVDVANKRAIRAGQSVPLSPTQAAILYTLNANQDRVVDLSEIHRNVYGKYIAEVNPRSDNTLRVQITALRRKVEPLNIFVRVEFSEGYRLEFKPLAKKTA